MLITAGFVTHSSNCSRMDPDCGTLAGKQVDAMQSPETCSATSCPAHGQGKCIGPVTHHAFTHACISSRNNRLKAVDVAPHSMPLLPNPWGAALRCHRAAPVGVTSSYTRIVRDRVSALASSEASGPQDPWLRYGCYLVSPSGANRPACKSRPHGCINQHSAVDVTWLRRRAVAVFYRGSMPSHGIY